MKVVYLNPSGQIGGAEVVLLDMLASLRKAEPEWEFHLVVPADGILAAKAKALGATVSVLPFPASLARLGDAATRGLAGNDSGRSWLLIRLLLASPGIARYSLRLRRVLRQFDANIVHTNGFKMHILGALAKPRQVPVIWHIHDYVRSRPVMSTFMKLLNGRCSIALANSNSVALDVKAACGDVPPVQTIYNAVDTAVFSPEGPCLDLDQLSSGTARILRPDVASQEPSQQELALIRIGLVATFARWKGHETFLRALSLLPKDLAWRGYIIGGAIYETEGSQYSLEELKSMAQSLGILDHMGFTGFIDEPAAAMRSLDVVVHASTQPEPFGLVIAEAMSCGRALIISESGGAVELIEPGVNALAHPPGDAAALAERITRCANDSRLRERLGAAARATAKQRFDRDRQASELIPIYEGLLRQRSDAGDQWAEAGLLTSDR